MFIFPLVFIVFRDFPRKTLEKAKPWMKSIYKFLIWQEVSVGPSALHHARCAEDKDTPSQLEPHVGPTSATARHCASRQKVDHLSNIHKYHKPLIQNVTCLNVVAGPRVENSCADAETSHSIWNVASRKEYYTLFAIVSAQVRIRKWWALKGQT